jgi:hypothetical protein
MSLRGPDRVHRSPATAHRWWHRWRAADAGQRRSLVCLLDESSRPRRCPRMLSGARSADDRRRTGWGPQVDCRRDQPPARDRLAIAHVPEVSRQSRARREQRYEPPSPVDLLNNAAGASGGSADPGHAATGRRNRTGAEKRLRVAWEFVHSIVKRPPLPRHLLRLHRNERAATGIGFVERALAFESHAIEPKR